MSQPLETIGIPCHSERAFLQMMFVQKRTFSLLIVTLALLGAGCLRTDLPEPNGTDVRFPVVSPVETVTKPETADGAWHAVENQVERLEYFSDTLSAVAIIYRFQPDVFLWRFEHASESRMMDAWALALPSDMFVINGVYFHEDYSPSGFLAAHGKRIGDRQFDMDKTGLIDFTSGARLIDTSQTHVDLKTVREGAQSYPFFIKQGKAAITSDSGLVARRSFIGTDTQGRIYLGVVPSQPVTLYQLMTLLQGLDVSWDMALNLDGGPSTGLVANMASSAEQIETYLPVPNVIVVERKKN